APRGVATTAAGNTVWVVDANKNVYVYDNHGVPLGSWSASSLSVNAQLTGIATNGTDLWLVDSSSDKVYKYAGAANRLSGSQTAASSFSLVGGRGGDANPQDIVTDGTSFWVVDGTALKVFKYTLAGSLLGSWAIDPANASPTGLTINPANVSDIWIVDSGTDKVYQYTNAAGLTSGSLYAPATFALAAGNTNPQDIADPPPPELLLPATVPTPDSRDGLFVLLLRESLQVPGEHAFDSTADAAGGPNASDRCGNLAPASEQRADAAWSAADLWDDAWTENRSRTTTARDALFAVLADRRPAEDGGAPWLVLQGYDG